MAYDFLYARRHFILLATIVFLTSIVGTASVLSASSSTGPSSPVTTTVTTTTCRNCNSTSTVTITTLASPSVSSVTTDTTSRTTTTSSSASTTSTCQAQSCFNEQDYQLWVQPYLAQLEKIRAVLMQPYTLGSQHYGYDPTFGMIRGGNIEPSPAIRVSGGYNDVIVAIDNNLEGSYSLDYFNSPGSVLSSVSGFHSVDTNIYGNVRSLLSKSWLGIGGCSSPFSTFNYPTSFRLLDRREAEYGFVGPYASTLEKSGNHLGGIGSSCGTQGQTWFLPQYDRLPTSTTQPLIVTEFPSSQPIASTGNLEELSFYIDQMYMQCVAGTSSCSLWQSAYMNAMSQYPFSAPRDALHFIQATRATGAWAMNNMTYNGISAKTMLQNTINRIFSSAVGPQGGLYQSFGGGGSDQTPEPNFQAVVAFDPRMPSWFKPGA